MKQLLYIALLLFSGHSVLAASYTCHTEAGELQSHIPTSGESVTQLTVTGTLDARDFAYMGDSLTNLNLIDLEDCTIAAYESRDTYLGNQARFEAHTLPAHTFLGFQKLTMVKLPKGTQVIGEAAFAGCPALTTIVWGEQLRSIGDLAFSGCPALDTPLPATLRSIGEYSFAGCTAYTELNLESAPLKSIGANAFAGCTRLAAIALPASLQTIGDRCFAGCSALTAIALPAALQSLGEGCFAYCTSLSQVDMKRILLTSIPAYAFDHCTSLTSLHTPAMTEEIGEGAFYYCTSLLDCTLPTRLREIADYAFAGCSRMEHLSFLPEGLERIGRWPFYGMRQLYSATIPSTVTYIGDHAFDSCTRLAAVMAYPTEPPALGEEVFLNVQQADCALGAPDESIELYRNAPQWQEFDIRHFSNREEIADDHTLQVYFEHEILRVKASDPMQKIALYTLDGRIVHREEGETYEWAIDTRSYTGPIFVLSIQMQSGEYRHLKVGRNR